jgi:hypothetical protein
MTRNALRWVLGLVTCLMLVGIVFAQVSANYDLSWHLLSGGGGARSSTNCRVDDALGPPAGPLSSSPNYEICPGYWCGVVARAGEARKTYLPLVLRNAGP